MTDIIALFTEPDLLIGLGAGFGGAIVGIPLLFAVFRLFCLYLVVKEGEARVFILFGKVVAVIDTPGLHFPISKLGLRALLVRFFGSVRKVDMR